MSNKQLDPVQHEKVNFTYSVFLTVKYIWLLNSLPKEVANSVHSFKAKLIH